MKIVLSLITTLIASASVACPNLSGTYSCVDEDGVMEEMTYSQSETNGITTYLVTDVDGALELIADGQVRELPETPADPTFNTLYSYSCENDTLVSTYWSQHLDSNGKEISKTIDLTEVISLDVHGNIQFKNHDGLFSCSKK